MLNYLVFSFASRQIEWIFTEIQNVKKNASVLITKFIYYFRPLFPFYCVKIFNRSDAMLSNFALYKEKIDAKIQ